MAQRGRKSAAALAAVATVSPIKRRLPPPSQLPELEQQIWRETTAAFAVDFFEPGDVEIMKAYVSACATLARFLDEAEGAPALTAGSTGNTVPNPIFGMCDRERNTIARLAVKLRITKQSRMEAKTAGSRARAPDAGAAAQSAPWQRSA